MPSRTPFFQAFGALLFGRRPRKLVGKVQQLRSLGEIYELFGEMLPERLLGRSEKGANSRERLLTPKVTFWAFVSQVFDVGSSCRDVVRKVEAWWRWSQKEPKGRRALTASAYCQARARLDFQTLQMILKHLSWSLERRVLDAQLWLGRRVKIVDGTTFSMPDTAANQRCWPQPASQKEGLGFPCMKMVGVFSLGSGGLEDYATGTLHQHESMLFRELWSGLRKGEIIVGDRAFCSYAAMAQLADRGVDSVMRLHQARKVTFRAGRKLGHDDRLLTWTKPAQRAEAWSLQEWEALPESMELRVIRLQVSTPGFRTHRVTLVTTLTNAEAYPAEEIRALYAQRWAVELHFYQMKILLGLDILRCQSPELIEKEALVHLIAYNLIRLLMQQASEVHGTELGRISFKGTLDTVRHFAAAIHAASGTPRRQQALIDQMLAIIASDPVPERPGRSEPRAKKRRAKNYHLLTQPRRQMQVPAHRNRPRSINPKRRLS
jgi:hypothetical protein